MITGSNTLWAKNGVPYKNKSLYQKSTRNYYKTVKTLKLKHQKNSRNFWMILMITKGLKSIKTHHSIYPKEKNRKNRGGNKGSAVSDSGNSFAVKDRLQKTISYHQRDSLKMSERREG